MAQDSLGNAQIDFVWGNFPLQPNYVDDGNNWNRALGSVNYPGDGEAEYFLKGHSNGTIWSTGLDTGDSHTIALRKWNNFPEYDPNTGNNLTVNWWDVVPAFEFPNVIGKTVDEAIKDLAACGVDPNTLVPIEFDSEDPYGHWSGYVDGVGYIDPIPAPGSDYPGVVFYRYYAPGTQIGTHWDGRPWYAEESENCVIYTGSSVGERVAVTNYPPSTDPAYWHVIIAIQTTDPNKNSYQWWD